MKRLLVALLLPFAAHAAAPSYDWAPNLTTTVAWDGNITNGEAVWDRIGALRVNADLIGSSKYDLSASDAVHLTAHFGGDWVPRFDGLNGALAGAHADWQHVFGKDALAPVFTVEGGADMQWVHEKIRRGFASEVTLRLSKRFGSAWRAAILERFDNYNARAHVFDTRGSETTLQVGRDIGPATRVMLSARYRDGDVVTYAQYHRPDLVAIARDYLPVTTFGERMAAYSVKAKTVAGRVALVHATAEDTALELAYEYAQTRTTGLKFADQIVSLSWIRQY